MYDHIVTSTEENLLSLLSLLLHLVKTLYLSNPLSFALFVCCLYDLHDRRYPYDDQPDRYMCPYRDIYEREPLVAAAAAPGGEALSLCYFMTP